MFRQIVIPTNTHLILQVPKEFVGQKVEVTVNQKEKSLENRKKLARKRTDKSRDDFYNSIRIDMSHFKFDREKAHERKNETHHH